MTQEELYAAMLAEFESRTGFAMDGNADLAVRLHAAAAQLASLYTYADWSSRQAFPQTAMGEYLDYHGAMRGLTRRTATRAEGTLRFSLPVARTADISVPEGTVCTTAGLVRFVTTQAGAIAAGALYVDIAAQAEEAGSAGNVGADTITSMTLAPVGVSACTNPAAFSGGMDGETDEVFRGRILDTYQRLQCGANTAFYETRVLETEGVAAVKVLPRYAGIGTVGVVVTSPTGPADAQLLADIAADLDSVREIAVDVTVMAPETVTVDITAALTVADGYDAATVLETAREAMMAYFDGTLLGCSVYRARLGSLLYAIPGVENYSLSLPGADVAITSQQLPVLGTLTITEAN